MFKKSLLALLALSTVTACSSGAGSKNQAQDAAEGKKEPVELTVYYQYGTDWSEDDFKKVFAEPVNKKFPNVTLKYLVGGKGQNVPDLITAGQKIDILFTSIGLTSAQLLENGLQYDISPLIKKKNYDLGKLDPTMVDAAKKLAKNNGIYGLPVYVPPSTVYYNKDVFDKFGVPYPKDGMTWDDMYETSKKLTRTDGGIQYWGIGSSYQHLALMNQFSLPLVDGTTNKTAFNTDDRWKTWVNNLTRFYQIPNGPMPDKLSEPNERNRFFKDRSIGMFLAVTALHSATELGDMNWDLTSFPVFSGNPIGPQAYPTYFYVTSMSDRKDDAFDVIAYLTSEEYQTARAKEGSLLPTLSNHKIREQFGQDNPLYKGKNVKALQPDKYAPAGSVNPYNKTGGDDLASGIKDTLIKNKDVNTMLRDVTEALDKKIEQAETAKK
ncbi:ABC transporter substrate-binding protein [Paenibacillus allorhizosphaerae]|uniref:Extracellular solute-binding protein n=1 Tax=Paenibacillus allorhizosphaerae TaxID=2849866 RepID=A0ABN7TJG2_9BACL|nr:ABC transporter substrate-binding protein [Paenibacillus allorhizosphaerae]CAG7638256.1 hypothetical protein PAECIP111802_02421 [Paenibacillus allorhizosphaerae]